MIRTSKIANKLIVAGWLTALSACASKPMKIEFFHPDGPSQKMNLDRYQCLQEAQQREQHTRLYEGSGRSTSIVITNNELLVACMKAKGYAHKIIE